MESRRRVPVAEAARILGITPDAVRKRMERGNIQGERDERGRIHVYLPLDTTSADTLADHSATVRLIEELQAQNEYLREENRRKDHLLAAALERIPAIEAPEGRGSPVTSDEAQGKGPVPPESEGQQGERRRSWWRRLFSS